MRMAVLMLPSSIFDITAAAIAALQSFDLLTRVSAGGLMTSVTERFKKSDAVLFMRPGGRGAFNMVELKLRNVDHASTDVGSVSIVEIVETNSWAQWARAD